METPRLTNYEHMPDADLRGLVLEALCARRRDNTFGYGRVRVQNHGEEPEEGQLKTGLEPDEVSRLLLHLQQYGLAELDGSEMGDGSFWISYAAITALGIDVVQGTRTPTIAIAIHATNAQVGDGNTLHHA